MNKVILVGRVTKDIELRHTQDGTAIVRFTLAVDRRNKEKDADFISCTAWNKVAELMELYVKRGAKIGIVGRITTGSYTNREGQKIYTTEVTVEDLEFLEKKQEQEGEAKPEKKDDDFMNIPDGELEGLPF